MEKLIIDILGWLGAVAYLLSYFLVSTRKLAGDSPAFQGLNVLGGVTLVVNSVYYRVWPSVALNAVWGAIAVVVLVKKIRQKTP